jgi:subtilisin family serine protease
VNPNAIFVLGLRARHVTKASRIHVYSLTPADIEPHSPEGSVIVPATSPLVVAVGAINLSSNGLESFSSQGPTDDGRVKPDLTAPDGNTSESGLGGRFGGTSAACPHAAGFAALIKQIDPVLNGSALRDQLVAAVKPRGISPPNNSYGY